MPKKIIAVGFDLPGEHAEEVSLTSKQSLLDADIVLFSPSIHTFGERDEYQGKRCFSDSGSHVWSQAIAHWRRELADAVAAGKLVLVMLPSPVEIFVATGQASYHGTGRNRSKTRHVAPVSSVDMVPGTFVFREASGTGMSLDASARVLAPFWSKFSQYSSYHGYFEHSSLSPLLRTKSGERVVGCYSIRGRGGLFVLPYIDFNQGDLVYEDEETREEYWSEEGLQLGHEFVAAIVALDDSLKSENTGTPPPTWATSNQFRMRREEELVGEITQVTNDISRLEQRRAALEIELDQAGQLRALLFEQGQPLEASIISALKLFGFTAENYNDGESEFDAVFICDEGRFIGEAEGRDSKEINISKFSQLERNIAEDFARDDVETHAKGVLFGNPHRLMPPGERTGLFTAKCLSAAKRTGAALVHTPDLFEPARYLAENSDPDFAKRCRTAIAEAAGEIVVFPECPQTSLTVVNEGGDP